MEIVIGIIVGLLVLMCLVVAHEFGHFIMARRNGVNVLEFGIGFPPRAIAWVKDRKTGKWRRLKRTEWEKESPSRVVIASSSSRSAVKADEATDKGGKRHGELAQRGMIFSLNWLPIGGFCQMDGESAADERKGTFGKATFWQKTKILFGGVTMNWLVAIVIFTILAWVGMPEFIEGQFTIGADTRTVWTPVRVATVMDDSPAAEAGMLAGDYILEVGGEKVRSTYDVTDYNSEHAGKEVEYRVRRSVDCSCPPDAWCVRNCPDGYEDYEYTLTVKLNPADSEYLLGVSMEGASATRYSTWSAPLVGVGLTAQLTGQTFQGLGEMLWNLVRGVGSLFSFDSEVRESGQAAISAVGDSVSGPVGIIGVLFPAFTAAGPANLAFLAGLISVSLACMNVLPIPALDGGRWFLIAIYRLRHKKLTKEVENKIVTRAFMVLLALMFIVTILDIARFF